MVALLYRVFVGSIDPKDVLEPASKSVRVRVGVGVQSMLLPVSVDLSEPQGNLCLSNAAHAPEKIFLASLAAPIRV